MYSEGADFEVVGADDAVGDHKLAIAFAGARASQAGNKAIIVNIAAPMGMTSATAGSGVVILSKIQQISDTDCSGAGLGGSSCSNDGKDVITNRIVIGNSAYTSHYGTPNSSLMDSQGTLSSGSSSSQGYLNNSTAVATGFGSEVSAAGISPPQGYSFYLSEAYFVTPDVSYLGGPASGGVYVHSIF